MRICLLGASFDTGNLGVSALAEGSIKCILNRRPDAEISVLAGGYAGGELKLRIMGKEVRCQQIPVSFSKNIFLSNHFCVLMLYSLLLKLMPWQRAKEAIAGHNACLKAILRTDLAADITGGDSFSDIYGVKRFVYGCLSKLLFLQLGKKLVMLPQTYGPFNGTLARMAAKYILKRATVIYSRDRAGMRYVQDLLNNYSLNGKIRFLPDVGFVLDAQRPAKPGIEPLSGEVRREKIVVGLNISGLLFNGGYTRDNMFRLRVDYAGLIHKVIEVLMEYEKVIVLLVPHVFPRSEDAVESDTDANLKIYRELNPKYPGRMFVAKGEYNQNEIKYIIGLCDFFVGSRMHACIAAMSQNIATTGIAYSKKFNGVFESVGLEDCIADARIYDESQLLEKVRCGFEQRGRIQEYLKRVMPQIKESVLKMFEACADV